MPTTATSKHWNLYIFAGKSIGVAFCFPAPANWLDAFLNCRQYYTKLCAISLCLFWCSATHFENNNMNIPIWKRRQTNILWRNKKTKNSVEHQFIVVIWFRRFGKRYIIFRICTIFRPVYSPIVFAYVVRAQDRNAFTISFSWIIFVLLWKFIAFHKIRIYKFVYILNFVAKVNNMAGKRGVLLSNKANSNRFYKKN